MTMTLIRVLDVETTGTDPAVDRVVEIATVDVTVDADGTVTRGDMWSSLVNPGRPIPPEASAVHHITDEMVADAAGIADVLDRVTRGPPAFFCAHNAKFDSSFIPPGIPWLCTYRTAVQLWPDCPSHSNQCLRYWLKLKLAEQPGEAHRALGDAYITAAILRRALAAGATIDAIVRWSSEPMVLPRFRFGKHAKAPIAEIPGDYLSWLLRQPDMDEDVRYTARTELARRGGQQ